MDFVLVRYTLAVCWHRRTKVLLCSHAASEKYVICKFVMPQCLCKQVGLQKDNKEVVLNYIFSLVSIRYFLMHTSYVVVWYIITLSLVINPKKGFITSSIFSYNICIWYLGKGSPEEVSHPYTWNTEQEEVSEPFSLSKFSVDFYWSYK